MAAICRTNESSMSRTSDLRSAADRANLLAAIELAGIAVPVFA
jgi:hypothetical protein